MKKKALALLFALLLISGLCACGSASAPMDATASSGTDVAESRSGEYDYADGEYAGISTSADGQSASGNELPAAADDTGVPVADKIVYSAYAEIETRDFEASVEGVYELIDRYGGFLESSSITGNDYNASRSTRSARFTIRIPSQHFEELTGSLTELGNVPYKTTSADNITARYNDAQSRLDAYEIEYDRLLSMLEKAGTVEDMLAIEDRLSDVRYNIQSISNTLSGWDSLLSYSTVDLSIEEVAAYTADPEQSYWEEVGEAFSATLKAVGNFFRGLFKAIVAFSPVIVILAAVGVVVLIVLRRAKKRRTARTLPPEGADGGEENQH